MPWLPLLIIADAISSSTIQTLPDANRALTDINGFLAMFRTTDTAIGGEDLQDSGGESGDTDDPDQQSEGAMPDAGAAGFGDSATSGSNPGTNPVTGPPPPFPGGQAQPPAVPVEQVQPPPAPANQLPQPGSQISDQGAGSSAGGKPQTTPADAESTPGSGAAVQPAAEIQPKPIPKVGPGSISSSSSSFSWGGGGSTSSGFNLGAGTGIAGGFVVSYGLRTVLDDDAEMDFEEGNGRPTADHDMPPVTRDTGKPPVLSPVLGPDPYTAWQDAADAYRRAGIEVTHYKDDLAHLQWQARHLEDDILIAENRIHMVDAQITNETEKIGANLTANAHDNVTIFEQEALIRQWQTQTTEAGVSVLALRERVRVANDAIKQTQDAAQATDDPALLALSQQIVAAQRDIISETNKLLGISRALTSATTHAIADARAEIAIADARAEIETIEERIALRNEASDIAQDTLIEGQMYTVELRKYIGAKTFELNRLPALIHNTKYFMHQWDEAWDAANELLYALRAFQGSRTHPADLPREIDHESGHGDDEHYGDDDMPRLPADFVPSWTGATHTTTTSAGTGTPTDGQSGSHPAAGLRSFNVAPDMPATGGASLQVGTMSAPSVAGSSAMALHFDDPVQGLPTIHAIVDAWDRTQLPVETTNQISDLSQDIVLIAVPFLASV